MDKEKKVNKKEDSLDMISIREMADQFIKRMAEAKSPEEQDTLREEWIDRADHLMVRRSRQPEIQP